MLIYNNPYTLKNCPNLVSNKVLQKKHHFISQYYTTSFRRLPRRISRKRPTKNMTWPHRVD